MLAGHEPDGDTQYRIGSLTKMFVAVLVMRLRDEGRLVGRLRGQDWTQALRREILDPLGMTRTTTSPEPPHARGFAVHPWADAVQLEPAEPSDLMAPAGELWSTADDLCRLAAFLLDGEDRVLVASTLAEMREPASPPGDDAWAGADVPLAARPDPDGWRAG
jgi:CubicO group peptidase (beta-lactamase class C family)